MVPAVLLVVGERCAGVDTRVGLRFREDMCRFGVLGSIEVRADGRLVPIGGARQMALLTFFLLNRGRRIGVDELVDAVWEELESRGSAKRVQVAVARLRRSLSALGDTVALTTAGSGYRLEVRAEDIDVEVFARRIDDGRAALRNGRHGEALRALDEALALWRGRPLADVAAMRFAQRDIGRLEELRLDAVEARIDAELALGRPARAVGELEALVASHPVREGLTARLMLALYRSGRQADALEAFQRTRAHLAGELGLEPGPELRALQQRILTHDPELAAPRQPSDAGPSGGRRLPAAQPLVARHADIRAVSELLGRSDVRLVTVTGPGGVGKTSLALAVVAQGPAERVADGAMFVDLSRVDQPEMVPVAILEALGAPVTGDVAAHDRLVAALGGTPRLLVLDNFEHVLAAAGTVGALLDACPNVRVLATSRAPLGLRAEHRWPLAPLAVTGGDADDKAVACAPATELFLARASARDPALRLADHAAAIATICERTGGLPLAIELAAARVAMLSPSEIAERMAAGALDLRHDLTDAPARHQSLRATLGWSYRLLTDAQRDAFDRFAAFMGGATPAMAETVTGASAEDLEGLVAHSMLVRRDGALGTARVVMLEPIREFAGERLTTEVERGVRLRHAAAFAEYAEAGRAGIYGRDWAAWRDRLADDLGNFRTALAFAIDAAERETALRIASALRKFWDARGLTHEGHDWLARALDMPGQARPVIEARATLAASFYAFPSGPTGEQATDRAMRAATMFAGLNDAAGEAEAYLSLGATLLSLDRIEEARAAAARAGELAPGHPRLRIMRMHLEVRLAEHFDDAAAIARTAIAEMHATGVDLMHESAVLGNCALVALRQRRYSDALAWIAEAEAVSRAARDLPGVAFSRADEGCAALGTEDRMRAAEAFTEALEIVRAIGFFEVLPDAAVGMAALAVAAGDIERAALLSGAALDGPTHALAAPDPWKQWIIDERLKPARQRAPERWEAAARVGARMSEHELIETALRTPATPATPTAENVGAAPEQDGLTNARRRS